jgi:hypothetical protein
MQGSGCPPVGHEDYAQYRLLYPEELRRWLDIAGFDVLALYDNREFGPSDLGGRIPAATNPGGMGGRKLYVFARRR